MLKYFFKTSWRNITRHTGFSFINIAGLAFSITACLIIALFIWDEKQYDQFMPGKDNIYRVYTEKTGQQGSSKTTRTVPMIATSMGLQFPEVETTARIMDLQSKSLFEAGDKKLYEEGGFAADPDFFTIFPLEFEYGFREKSLIDPASMVITEKLSRKYFGDGDPVGKQILVDKEVFVVRGVIKDNTDKFHLKLSYIIPMEHAIAAFRISPDRMQSWGWQQFFTYVKVKNGSNIPALQAKLQRLVKQQADPKNAGKGFTYVPYLQPLKNVHLYSADFKLDIAARGNIVYINALTSIGIFILLIACFNFINLSTAKSLQRAKEVGVKKSIGASRRQLLVQYIGETVLLSVISFAIAIVLAVLLLPVLNQFTDKHISAGIFLSPQLLALMPLLAIFVGILAGFYPALVLSGFQPVKVLKGSASDSLPGRVPWLRHSLVLIQFTLSSILIVSAIVVLKQVNYLHNKDLGFNKEQIMFFPMRGDKMYNNYQSFKNELGQSPGISGVSIGYGFPGDIFASDDISVPEKGGESVSATQLMVDADYIKTLGLHLVSGRDFLKNSKTDEQHAFIINETAVRELGFKSPQKAIGQNLDWKVWDSKSGDSLKHGQVIGVVKDFHYKSLYDKINTTVLQIYPPANWKVAVKMKTAGVGNTVAYVKQVWKKFTPDFPIEYRFMDENFDQMYKSEDKLKTLLTVFTGIAIFVGCLGLFGLAAYSAERRAREIGIRKVLGASVKGIVLLLSGDFVKLVLISVVIASPVARYFMSNWLQSFAYRISIAWWIFALSGALAIIIALITVSFQAVKAAFVNPVKSLRTE